MNEVKPFDPRDPDDRSLPAAPPGLSMLRRDQAPRRDLWPSIESRLHAPKRARGWPTWAAAAGAAAVATAVTLAVSDRLHSPTLRHAPLRAPAEVVAATLPAHGAGSNGALQAVVSHPLHAETRALLRANLKIVDNAESELKRAINTDPDAAYLRSLLASTQQQKQELRVVLADAHP